MRVAFPYRGCNKALKIVMMFLILCGVYQVEEAKYGFAYLPQGKLALAEEVKDFTKPSLIKGIEVAEQENDSIITIKASKPLTYTVVKLKGPLRIVVDLPSFTTEHTIEPLTVNNEVINEIINRQMEKGERMFCRIEIGLKQDVEYEVTSINTDLIIRVAGTKKLVGIDEKAVEGDEVKEELDSIGVKNIIDLEFSKELDGMTVISDSAIGNHNDFVLDNPYRLIVDIPGVHYRLPKNIYSFQSAFVDKVEIGQHLEKVRFVVYFRDKLTTYQIEKDNNKLFVIWEMPALAKKEEKVEEVVAEEIPVEKEEAKEVVEEAEEVSEEPHKVTSTEGEELEEEVFTGQKISLDFKDADIRNLIRLIADISGLNIIVSDNVKGKVTIKLENIPWDQVLDVILETNSLGKIWMKNVLRIETRKEIQRMSDEKYRSQKSLEKVADLKNEVVDIIYRDAADVLNLLVKEKELTSDRGAISVDPNLNRIIITDTPEKIAKIKEKIVRYDDRTVRQVYIEARIVQSIPTFTKEIGIKWGGIYAPTRGRSTYGVGGSGGIEFEKEDVTDPITGLTRQVLKNVISNGNLIDLPAPAGPGTGGGIGFGILRRNLELTATLSAMEKDEKLKIISNPRILSIDKNEAMIKQGVALPYLKLSEEGVTSTEFKDAVLELRVTPTILSEKIIKIEINVKKDQKSAQTGAGGEPGIDIREARTVLMVESGRTVVIGGIYEETTTIIRTGVPFLSGIPAFGRLFRNDFHKKELTELLIFLTTTIVPKEIMGADY